MKKLLLPIVVVIVLIIAFFMMKGPATPATPSLSGDSTSEELSGLEELNLDADLQAIDTELNNL